MLQTALQNFPAKRKKITAIGSGALTGIRSDQSYPFNPSNPSNP